MAAAHRFLLILFALSLAGCAALRHPGQIANSRNDGQGTARLEWLDANPISTRTNDGRDLFIIPVRPGQIVRITSDRPLEVGERQGEVEGSAELWRKNEPQNGLIFLRAGLFTTAFLLPNSSHPRHVHIGQTEDLGYAWFAWERAIVEWAKGPIGAAFPSPASSARLDVVALKELDQVLAEELAASNTSEAGMSAHALRSVVGLRSLRAIRPLSAFPYAAVERLEPTPHSRSRGAPSPELRDIDQRTFYLLSPEADLAVSVTGPRLMTLAAFGVRGEGLRRVTVRVEEHGRTRGVSSSPIGRLSAVDVTATDQDSSSTADKGARSPDLARMRSIVVHVPPGVHRYRLRSFGGRAYVLPSAVTPTIHVEDAIAGTFDETRALAQAAPSCSERGSPGLCLIYLALQGKDEGAAWDHALQTASPKALKVARSLASGGPREPNLRWELAASSGVNASLRQLDRASSSDVDDTLGDAWWRATVRATSWQPATPTPKESAPDATAWLSVPRQKVTSECLERPSPILPDSLLEVAKKTVEIESVARRHYREVTLLVRATCSEKGRVVLEVDGQKMSAAPRGPQALWHLAVKGPTARIRVEESAGAKIFAVPPSNSCFGGLTSQAAPSRLDAETSFTFDKGTTIPGIEVWLQEGTAPVELELLSTAGNQQGTKVRVTTASSGLLALDPEGKRWVRAARVGLPAWTVNGFSLASNPRVAVRLIKRLPSVPEAAEGPATPLAAPQIIRLSRAIRETSSRQKLGDLYAQRALLLAQAGARDFAIADALAVKKFGSADQFGKDPVLAIQDALQLPAPETLSLAEAAYPLDADFDEGARRCELAPSLPRRQVEALEQRLKARDLDAPFDRELGAYAARVAFENPRDPRMPWLLRRALSGSEWRSVAKLATANLRVNKPRAARALSNETVKAWHLAGATFDSDYVTVTDARPASAILAQLGGANLTLHYVCIARVPSLAEGSCPLRVGLGGAKERLVSVPRNGEGEVRLSARELGGSRRLVISVGASKARWAAVVQLVFDKAVPGTRQQTGLGFVLETPRIEYRHLVQPAVPLRVKLETPGVIAIDALAEGGAQPKLQLRIDGQEKELPQDGERRVFPVSKTGEVDVRVVGGSATIGLVQRLESPKLLSGALLTGSLAPKDAENAALVDEQSGDGWQKIALQADAPSEQGRFGGGTLSSATGVVSSALPEDTRVRERSSAYLEERAEYRRRFEAPSLWTRASVIGRARLAKGSPSYGVSGLLYQDGRATRLRFSGSTALMFQRIETRNGGKSVRSFRPRAFIEYSLPLSGSAFLLPRVGYDGFYTTLSGRPLLTEVVDDEVWSSFRASRPTLLYGQLLGWWVPYFNQIIYARPRLSFNATTAALDTSSLRVGSLTALGRMSGGLYLQADRSRVPSPDGSYLGAVAGAALGMDNWIRPKSVNLRPTLEGSFRSSGSWQIALFVNLLASEGNGLRDFSSGEVDFPEQEGGGVPWRGPYREVVR